MDDTLRDLLAIRDRKTVYEAFVSRCIRMLHSHKARMADRSEVVTQARDIYKRWSIRMLGFSLLRVCVFFCSCLWTCSKIQRSDTCALCWQFQRFCEMSLQMNPNDTCAYMCYICYITYILYIHICSQSFILNHALLLLYINCQT